MAMKQHNNMQFWVHDSDILSIERLRMKLLDNVVKDCILCLEFDPKFLRRREKDE